MVTRGRRKTIEITTSTVRTKTTATTSASPCYAILKGDNIVKVLCGQKWKALELLPDRVQRLAHPHCVHLGLQQHFSNEVRFDKEKQRKIFLDLSLIFDKEIQTETVFPQHTFKIRSLYLGKENKVKQLVSVDWLGGHICLPLMFSTSPCYHELKLAWRPIVHKENLASGWTRAS